MSSISEAVRQSLNAWAASGDATFQAINLRNKLHKDLSDLLTHVDTLAWKACQTEGNFGPILDKVYKRSAAITYDLENSNSDPTPAELADWKTQRTSHHTTNQRATPYSGP